ncbi:MAG: DUF1573 domain-containing protein [Phycisphaerales bacterium]|nr:DUF1573 domain-containing protein [Phycisphaerales bacterium]
MRNGKWMLGLLVGLAVSASYAQEEKVDKPADQATDTNAPRPKVQLSQTVWDFGEVWSGEPATAEIKIENVGNADLDILRVKTSCGCTAAKPKKNKLVPGESDSISLSYNTSKRKTDVSQYVTVETNDPESPSLRIHVKGTVKQFVDMKPIDRIAFGRLKEGDVVEKSIEIINNLEEKMELKLTPPGAEDPWEAKLEELDAGKRYRLTAKTRPPFTSQNLNGSIVLQTGLDRVKELRVPVNGMIPDAIEISPPRLFVPANITRPIPYKIRLRNNEPETTVKVVKVETNPEGVKAEVLPPKPEASGMETNVAVIEVEVTIDPAINLPDSGAFVKIMTDSSNPKFKEFTIPISKRVTPTVTRPANKVKPAAKPGKKKKKDAGDDDEDGHEGHDHDEPGSGDPE